MFLQIALSISLALLLIGISMILIGMRLDRAFGLYISERMVDFALLFLAFAGVGLLVCFLGASIAALWR